MASSTRREFLKASGGAVLIDDNVFSFAQSIPPNPTPTTSTTSGPPTPPITANPVVVTPRFTG